MLGGGRLAFALIGVLLTATGCGNTAGERGITGIGAGAGAVVGAVTGLSLVQGVVIGAAAGGLLGALTDKDTINIGDPFWKSGDGAQQSESGTVMYVQQSLADLGYEAGPADAGGADVDDRDALNGVMEGAVMTRTDQSTVVVHRLSDSLLHLPMCPRQLQI